MVAVSLLVATIGVNLNVHSREYLYLLFLALSVLTGSIGGFMSGRLYKFFNGTHWRRHTFVTVTAVPLFAAVMLAATSIAELIERERFGELWSSKIDWLYVGWALTDMLNIAIGCYLGYKADKI